MADRPARSWHPHKQLEPLVGECGRSLVCPNLFFVGFDKRISTLTLGNQGWDTGALIAKELDCRNSSSPPALPADAIAMMKRNRALGTTATVLAGSVFSVYLFIRKIVR